MAPFRYLRPKQHCPVCEFIILPSLTWQRHPHPEKPWEEPCFFVEEPHRFHCWAKVFGSLEHAPGYGFDLACSKAVESVCPHSSLTSPSPQPNATTPHGQTVRSLNIYSQAFFRDSQGGYQPSSMELFVVTLKSKNHNLIKSLIKLKSRQILIDHFSLDVFVTNFNQISWDISENI